MDGGKKNIYQIFSFEIWMKERKTYPPSISQMKMFGICFSFLHPYLK
jgi:hypothetical protein